MRTLLLATLCSSVAWASSLTPDQTAWLNTLYGNLYQGSPSVRVQQVWTHVLEEDMIDVDVIAPPSFGGGAAQMSPETCDALATGIRDKAVECGDTWEALESCQAAAASVGQDPITFCRAVQSSLNSCHSVLIAYVNDWNTYCYED